LKTEKGDMDKRIISLAFVAVLTLGIITFVPTRVKAKAADSVYLSPDTFNFDAGSQSVGYRFNVTAWMNLTQPCFAWQVKITFNNTWLACTKAGYAIGVTSGESEYFDGHVTSPVSASINNITGYVQGGESLQGSDTALPANKKLMFAEFQIMAAPDTGQTFTDVLDINNDKTYVLDPDLYSISISGYGSAVTYTKGGALPPYLAVSPSTDIVFGPSPPSAVGREFNVDVFIKDLDASWAVQNASFRLTYSCSTPPPVQLLVVVSVTRGPLWGSITFNNATAGVVDVNVTSPSSTPSGDVLLATIRFRVIFQDNSPLVHNAPLLLSNIALWSSAQQISTTPPVNGKVVVNGILSYIPGDVNGDGVLDMKDIAIVSHAYGTSQGHPRWDKRADISGPSGIPDGTVDLFDIVAVVKHWDNKPIYVPPCLAVSPSTDVVFGPSPPAVGQEFNISIYAKAVDAALGLQNASFRLTYSCSTPPFAQILAVVSVTKGPVWGTIAFDSATAGIVNVNVTSPSSTPSGDVLLATIRFRVIFAPGNAPLVLSNIALYIADGQIYTRLPISGNVIVK
jgi:hypothetical protein